MIDLMAIAAIDRETEITYIRRERGWAEAAAAEGRKLDPARMLPMLPATIAGLPSGNGNGNGNGNGHGHDHSNGHGAGTALLGSGHE